MQHTEYNIMVVINYLTLKTQCYLYVTSQRIFLSLFK